MAITFEDGSTLDSDDWFRIMSLIKTRAKEGKSKPVEIKQSTAEGTVTVKVKGYEPKPDAKGKIAAGPAYANFVESSHNSWKIRVWRMEKEQVYGCNYYKGEDVRYLEVPFGDVLDENGVFKYATSVINDIDE